MNIGNINAHLATAEPTDIRLGSPLGVVRSLYIGDIGLTFSATFSVESARKQAAVLTALSNAAIEAAHWLEDIAGDIEQSAQIPA